MRCPVPAGGNSGRRLFVGVTVRRTMRAVALALATAILAAACAGPTESSDAGAVSVQGGQGPYRGSELDGQYTLPDVSFTDTRGRPFDLAEDTTAPVTLVFFGYTSCPDVCNVVLANMASALRRVPPTARKKVEMVFVSTDPKRDTPKVVRDYLDRFDTSFTGLTAPMPTVRKAADALGVALTGTVKTAGGYEVGHGSQVIAFGTDEHSILLWTAGTAVADLRSDITDLARKADAS